MLQHDTLPELLYGCATLERHYSARVLELHHGKRHAAQFAADAAERAVPSLAN
jgi:superoxide dismutase